MEHAFTNISATEGMHAYTETDTHTHTHTQTPQDTVFSPEPLPWWQRPHIPIIGYSQSLPTHKNLFENVFFNDSTKYIHWKYYTKLKII